MFRASSVEGVGAGFNDESIVSSLLVEVLLGTVDGAGFANGGIGGIQQSWEDERGRELEVRVESLLFLSQHTDYVTTPMAYILYGGSKHVTSKKTKMFETLTSMPNSSEICASS